MLLVRASRLLAASAVAYALATVAFAGAARADVLPPNDCADLGTQGGALSPGQPCTTAGTNFDEDGVCTTETHPCSNNPTVDAGTCTWVLCELSDGGAPVKADAATPEKDAGKADATKPETKDAGKTTTSDASKPEGDAATDLASSSGCSISAAHGGSSAGDGAWFLALGALGLVVSLRRARGSRTQSA